jgi:hypothetical protein
VEDGCACTHRFSMPCDGMSRELLCIAKYSTYANVERDVADR